ncbi:nucleotidyltransferase domain-containing protein [Paenibacillus spongiae]|uniref:Nucleotidyltransferase domain-containing protein n=1 Tax=Paenibacillus spongiae TaxID=2909671 RepID=A0ABY5SB01_9BACL|nr:nucleotidyltransferase domain-containing protein [Paenibacillus spongiae]UVI31126.1 nucleotidyltransferase domain-containing protein [Paenibacillus spongiae]
MRCGGGRPIVDVQARIKQELSAIEAQEGVRILYACESGSRAWGFPSRDSDYDVRFIYIRPVDWYLSIFERRDVIERPIDDMLDINGWDLRKALNLFRKSNPPLLEWLQSPICYAEPYSAAEQIRALSAETFSPKSCMHHYLHMARGNYREYLQGDLVKIKKYFYVLRPVLACAWISERGTMPPIAFETLVREMLPPQTALMGAIDDLLVRKRAGVELDLGPRIGIINEYVERKMAEYEQIAGTLPSSAGDMDSRLDELFRAALHEAWSST